MATNQEKRNYTLTDAELSLAVSNLCNTLTRDVIELGSFGIT